MSLINIVNVCKDYHIGNLKHRALNNVSLTIDEGEFVAIAGPSGSGKTTLLNMIGCLDKPSEGDVSIENINIKELNSNQLSDLRNQKVGFIFQTFNLIPVLTAFENVEFPLLLKNNQTAAERKEVVTKALRDVELGDFMDRKPNELSGGQQQRVAVARALVKKPKLILADEPTANLDSQIGESILRTMKDLNKVHNISFIFSTHDQMVMDYASRLILLRDGQVAEETVQEK